MPEPHFTRLTSVTLEQLPRIQDEIVITKTSMAQKAKNAAQKMQQASAFLFHLYCGENAIKMLR